MGTNLDLYLVQCTAGHVGTPGAPVLNFSLVVHASTGRISGQASITQALPPPSGIYIHNVTGQLRRAGLGPITQLVALEGTYDQPGAPPAQFRAHFGTDAHWNGSGGFEYGTQRVEDVPVRSMPGTAISAQPTWGTSTSANTGGDDSRLTQIERQVSDLLGALGAIRADLGRDRSIRNQH